MEIHVSTQIFIFAMMLLCGAACGFLYDLFRAVRKVVEMNKIWVSLCDIAFWALCTAAAFGVARRTNHGELRWFEFAGMAGGALLYYLLLGNLAAEWLSILLRRLLRLLRWTVRILLFPVRLMARPVSWLWRKTAPLRRKLRFGRSVWMEKRAFSRRQLKKFLKSPKFF